MLRACLDALLSATQFRLHSFSAVSCERGDVCSGGRWHSAGCSAPGGSNRFAVRAGGHAFTLYSPRCSTFYDMAHTAAGCITLAHLRHLHSDAATAPTPPPATPAPAFAGLLPAAPSTHLHRALRSANTAVNAARRAWQRHCGANLAGGPSERQAQASGHSFYPRPVYTPPSPKAARCYGRAYSCSGATVHGQRADRKGAAFGDRSPPSTSGPDISAPQVTGMAIARKYVLRAPLRLHASPCSFY